MFGKAQLNLIASVVLVVLGLCGPGFAFSGAGSGTDSDPYIITTVEQLEEMNDDLGAHYALGNDIDASATSSWNGGSGFLPVGNQANFFTGKFDGRRHIITDLYINRPLENSVALFGYVWGGAEIKDVGIVNANVTGYGSVGTLVGYSNGSTVSNCFSSGSVTGTESGGVNSRVGGLVGMSTGGSSILRCYSTADVTSGAWQVGGLSGYNGHGSVVIDCYATGNVAGNHKVGGLVGDNCYPEGGFVKRCYSTGLITGGGGGLIGYNFNGGVTYDSYWDIETSGRTSSKGGTGKTTAEMMQQATFADWDFMDVWDIVEGQTYPFLQVFEQRELVGLEIVGQNKVAEDFSASYKAIAYYDNGSTKDITNSADWTVEPNSFAGIEAGLLTTKSITRLEEDISIYAQYSEGEIIVEADKQIVVFALCPAGYALQFDGVNDYVSLSENAITTTEFTVSAWANHFGQGGGSYHGNRIFTQRDAEIGDNHCSVCLATEVYWDGANCAYAGIRSSNGSIQRLTVPEKDYNEWHYYGMTVNSDEFIFYIDGSEVKSTSNNQLGDYVTSIDYVDIGRYRWHEENRGFFNGKIDEVRIYDRALTAEEILANMHAKPAGDESNLVGYWDFDEGEGQIVYDLSGNGNDAYLGSDPCQPDNSDPVWIESDAPIGIC